MAEIKTVQLVDDLDKKSRADEKVKFSLDGKRFEIDLTSANADALRGHFKKYTDVAKVMGTSTPGASGELAACREWLKAQGVEVGKKGRIGKELIERWKKETGGVVPEADTSAEKAPKAAKNGNRKAA